MPRLSKKDPRGEPFRPEKVDSFQRQTLALSPFSNAYGGVVMGTLRLSSDGEPYMTRAELLEAAETKLAEVVNLLAAAGEQRLAFDAEALAEQVGFSANGENPSPRHSR